MHCDVHFLRVISFTKDFIDIMYVLVPILLIVLVSIDLGKIVIGKTDDSSKILKTITKRVIAALIIFFVPLLVTFSMDLISYNDPNGALACWEYATDEIIEVKMKEADAKAKAEKEKREKEYEEEQKRKLQEKKDKIAEKQKEKEDAGNLGGIPENPTGPTNNDSTINIPKSRSLAPFVNGKQRALKEGDCMKQSDNCACPSYYGLAGFYFTMKTATGRDMNWTKRSPSEQMVKVTAKCSDGTTISKTVNAKVKSNYQTAFENICKLKTTGINGFKIDSKYLHLDGTLVERTTSSRTICSMHAYGTAIDINYDTQFVVNGKTYKPYASMGKSTRKEYNRFKEALGKEEHPLNVNYILWKYAFKPSGFTWGGTWSDSSFDPMHFEIK